MLDANGKRMLAYVQEIGKIEPLYLCTSKKNEETGANEYLPVLDKKGKKTFADNIEKAYVLGWTLVVKKGEFKPGDKCVFFEIDSKVPEGKYKHEDGTDVFDFLANKNYCVKTYKLNKFGVWSQGLVLPLSYFGLDSNLEVNTDLTETLGVTYAVPEDNVRKGDPREQAKKSYMAKHKKFFGNPLVKFLMRIKFFRWLFLLGMKKGRKDMKKAFPSEFVSKTDEERIQNMPWVLNDKTPLIATEKIDGTSTTWLLVRKGKKKFEFYVCSRNVRMFNENCETYNGSDNIYWENAIKYDVEKHLTEYLEENPNLKWVCIQGESYGEGWQGNPLKMKGHHFAAFNFKDSENGRWNSVAGKALLEKWGIPWVPILDTNFILPDTVEELLNIATAKSAVNPDVMREGIVFRSLDGKNSFKAVSPEYLLKHNG